MNTKTFFLCWEGSNLILGTGKENQIFILRTPATIKFFHQILKKWHFGIKKRIITRWICMTHVWSPTLFHGGIIIFQGVLRKFHILTKFPHLKKIVDLMKDLKYEYQSSFPLWGGSNLILGAGTEHHIFILRTPATINFFHQILKKWHFGVKQKTITHPDAFV